MLKQVEDLLKVDARNRGGGRLPFFLCDLQIEGLKMEAVIDTAARRNIMPIYWWDKLVAINPTLRGKLKPFRMHLQAANRGLIAPLGEITLTTTIQGHPIVLEYCIADVACFLLVPQSLLQQGFGLWLSLQHSRFIRDDVSLLLREDTPHLAVGIVDTRDAVTVDQIEKLEVWKTCFPTKSVPQVAQELGMQVEELARKVQAIATTLVRGDHDETWKASVRAWWLKAHDRTCEFQYGQEKTTLMQVQCDRVVALPVRVLQPGKREAAEEQVQKLCAAGAIRPSRSPFSAPMLMTPKGDSYRLCVDYRELNKVTKRDAFPLPRIDEILQNVQGHSFFATLDLRSGYHQIRMHPDSVEKTAFSTPLGLYEWNVMPFGLCNAPAVFQRMMNNIFRDMIGKRLAVYLDDILIFAKSREELLETIEIVFDRLRQNGLYLNVEKCMVGAEEFPCLGFIVSKDGLRPNPAKVAALARMPVPTDKKAVQRVLGLGNYFREFIPNYADRVTALSELTKEDAPWEWGEAQQHAFTFLTTVLTNSPIVLPFPHPEGRFILSTDASDVAVAAVLQQDIPGHPRQVIAYLSKTLTDGQRTWHTTEKEAFAIIFGVDALSVYLRNSREQFTIQCDHAALQYIQNMKSKKGIKNAKIERWSLFLQEYNYKVDHIKGSENVPADVLSRAPYSESAFEIAVNDRISMNAPVLATEEVDESAIPDPGDCEWWPTVDEFIEAQALEFTDISKAVKMKLTRQGRLWLTSDHKLYVPATLRSRLTFGYHCGSGSLHQGISRTVRSLSTSFWWPNMKTFVGKLIDECLFCRRRRYIMNKTRFCPGNLLTERPLQVVALDVVGPILMSDSHQYYFLTMIDHFTKFTEVAILKDLTMEETWTKFHNKWLTRWGVPTYLLTDNGTNFASYEFESRCKQFGITKTYSLPEHPQANGVVESFHQFFKKALAAANTYVPGGIKDKLRAVLQTYRSAPHPVTGETPFKLHTGHDFVRKGHQDIHDVAARQGMRMLHEIRQEAYTRMVAAVRRRYEKGMQLTREEIKVGDLVCYALKKGLSHGALQPRWSEPCRVIHRIGPSVVVVQSLWKDEGSKDLPISDLMKLAPPRSRELWDVAKQDLLSDLQRELGHRYTPQLGQIHCARLDHNLRTPCTSRHPGPSTRQRRLHPTVVVSEPDSDMDAQVHPTVVIPYHASAR